MKKYRALIIIIIAILLMAACSPQERPMQQMETNLSAINRTKPVEYCRITADTADVRTGTGLTFDTIGTLKRDDVVKVLGEVDNWYVVQMDNSQVGSIEAANATPVVMEDDAQSTPSGINPNTELTDTNDALNRNQILDPSASPNENATQPDAVREGGDTELNTQQQRTTTNNTGTGDTVGNLSNMAAQLVELVNSERTKNGLPSLMVDTEVARVAGIKSQDIVDNDYFSHNSPTYGSPFEMLDSFGIKYHDAGENLAGHQTVQSAHEALMNSAGHRQNILSNDYTHIGIGVRPSNRYGYVFTQLFISKPR